MKFDISYYPAVSASFDTDGMLQNMLGVFMRTTDCKDVIPSLSRGNIYLLRNQEGELEFFCNVATVGQLRQLQTLVSGYLQGFSAEEVYYQTVHINSRIPRSDLLDFFTDLTTEFLPEYWAGHCPSRGKEKDFLSDTVLCALHTDEKDKDGTIRYHVHRLFIQKSI